jgi:hypothetical protein
VPAALVLSLLCGLVGAVDESLGLNNDIRHPQIRISSILEESK